MQKNVKRFSNECFCASALFISFIYLCFLPVWIFILFGCSWEFCCCCFFLSQCSLILKVSNSSLAHTPQPFFPNIANLALSLYLWILIYEAGNLIAFRVFKAKIETLLLFMPYTENSVSDNCELEVWILSPAREKAHFDNNSAIEESLQMSERNHEMMNSFYRTVSPFFPFFCVTITKQQSNWLSWLNGKSKWVLAFSFAVLFEMYSKTNE